MNEPTFDSNGYPTEETLERIRTWPIKHEDEFLAAMDFAGRAWSYPDRWQREDDWPDPDLFDRPCTRYTFSTGGWSGNESIVSAIEANMILQMVGVWSWRRGGHYEYRFPVRQQAPEVER
jgi:hypothetical protein